MSRYLIFSIIAFVFIISCQSNKNREDYSQESSSYNPETSSALSAEESVNEDVVSSSNAQPNSNPNQSLFQFVPEAAKRHKDTSRLFIKTAHLKFRVDNVLNATRKIETMVNQVDGFYTSSGISTEVRNVERKLVSKDSVLETITYVIVNNMSVRVPSSKLDSTLYNIGSLIDFLDYKNINAEDISRRLKAQQLSETRNQELSDRLLKLGKNPTKTADGLSVEEALAKRLEQRDENKLEKWEILDQVQFSSINLNFYQNETTHRKIFVNPQNTEQYEPGFGSKLLESIIAGWKMFEAFLLFLFMIWPFLLLVVVVFLIIKNKEKIRNYIKKP